jgi:hypothetical protein
MSMTIPPKDIDELKRNVKAYIGEISTIKERQKILIAGARVVRATIKRGSYFKNSKEPRTYYSKFGNVQILPGNLRNSIYAFKTRDGNAEVGPRVLNPLAGKYSKIGDTQRTSSGYYAAMLFGSASAFRRQVTESAMGASLARIDKAMQSALRRIHRTWKKKYNL